LVLVAAALALGSCGGTPPQRVENACEIFEERPDWWEAARETEKKWGTPAQFQLAIIRQESGFRHDARPTRATFLGIPMWWRVSSAYGYPQALDETWDLYRHWTGNGWAERGDFEDGSDFVGWYTDLSQRALGISKRDAYNQYLAYHEGHGGWRRRSYRAKPWLLTVARKVQRQSALYGAQLQGCRKRLDQGRGWWPF
jgi:hypothetical protein